MGKGYLFCAAFVFTMLGCGCVFGQGAKPTLKQQLYLLAATPENDWGYPVTLYRVEGRKLRIVREVVPQTDGVRSVQLGGNTIFLVRGHIPQPLSVVSIIHTDDPLRDDAVPISGSFINPYELVLAQPRPPAVDELLVIGRPDPGMVNLFSISSDMSVSQRVRLNDWSEYAALRYEGAPGGVDPNSQIVFAEVLGDTLVIHNSFANQEIKLDALAPAVRDAANATPMHRLVIVASDQRYLLLKNTYNFEELKSGKAGNSHQIFVHDRTANRWKTIQVEGTSNDSRSRLFAPWLATIVINFNLNNANAGPGRENERGPDAFGDPDEIAGTKGNPGNARLPIVRGQVGGPGTFLPGVLLLDNINDGRRIRIETDQEDSEILSVRGDAVLYRVNDSIYQATIVGDKLQNSSVLVKDEDVPEIHWGFWGPQTH